MPVLRIIGVSALAVLASCSTTMDTTARVDPDTPPVAHAASAKTPARTMVDAETLLSADADNANWLTYGRDYSEQRYSPLTQINAESVNRLGLSWFADLDTARGQEATPLVIDGRIYITTAWSKVKAFDARTGAPIWEFDPEVPGEVGAKACCDVVNRGVAAWGDTLFLGTLDGRLIALDRDTGAVRWEKVTVDQSKSYTITGAPRVIDGKVIIGNGGAEFGVRGYVSAYDAQTGEMAWRFYTVPGAPGDAQPAHLQKAAETWHGKYWDIGGGGTVWDAMAYDADLDLLYIGVGNGSPWNQSVRSPGPDGKGLGDNLYLSSIVALRPATGEYVWHYQTTPGESWDYTATQHIILADLPIAGRTRKVLMQAPKNGFFYVLDRATGELISANNYMPVNWATHIDMETGRPVENPEARADRTGKAMAVLPGALGGHNWHPMAWHPGEKLVYIPTLDAAMLYAPDKGFKADRNRGFNIGYDFAAGDLVPDNKVRLEAVDATSGALVAWDPVRQEERWRVQFPGPWNGGVLATGGNLVFQGTAGGEFAAYRADNGQKVWGFGAQTGIVAPPITYSLDGEQYIAVMAGWGGAWALAMPGVLAEMSGAVPNISRLMVFKLGGTATLPPAPPLNRMPLDPPPSKGSPQQIADGKYLYGRYCGTCHSFGGQGTTVLPDLRRSAALSSPETWEVIVHDGALTDSGMVAFRDSLTKPQIEAIRHFVIARANEDKALEAEARSAAARASTGRISTASARPKG